MERILIHFIKLQQAEDSCNNHFICHCYAFVSLRQEREEAEALWEADGQSVVKKDEKEAEGTAGRNARSQAPKERGRGRGRVTGGRDEL